MLKLPGNKRQKQAAIKGDQRFAIQGNTCTNADNTFL